MGSDRKAHLSDKKTAIVAEELQGESYAVIEARQNGVLSEGFVIAYRKEESLRELIAGRSIIGIEPTADLNTTLRLKCST